MIFSDNLLFQIACALAVGIGLGAVYDVFRIIRCAFFVFSSENGEKRQKNGKNQAFFETFLQLILDLLFSIVYTIVIVLLVYYLNNGAVRLYILCLAVIGFFAYYFTVGRLVMRISDAIIRFTKWLVLSAVRCVYRFLLYPVLAAIYFIVKKVYAVCVLTPWRRVRTTLYVAEISSKIKDV